MAYKKNAIKMVLNNGYVLSWTYNRYNILLKKINKIMLKNSQTNNDLVGFAFSNPEYFVFINRMVDNEWINK